jgi:hypothetical protein
MPRYSGRKSIGGTWLCALQRVMRRSVSASAFLARTVSKWRDSRYRFGRSLARLKVKTRNVPNFRARPNCAPCT